jgi:decaprenylphospho-beta-D-ribofuranose 2-oxidase
MHAAPTMLHGWGRVRRSASHTIVPADRTALLSAFSDTGMTAHGLIVHAAGRSYGDCALNAEGSALLSAGLDRILDFDPASLILQVQPGVTFRRLMAEFLPDGLLVPVTPGTGFATIGGAVANDVHGKNHEHAGSFAQHVTELDLLTPDGVLRTIGPQASPDLFRATCGGLGLTGIITRIAFRLQPVPGPAVRVREQRLPDLDGFLAALDSCAGATYAVGWIDGTARGRRLGRGILETAEAAPDAEPKPPAGGLRVPVDFPGFALNPLSVRLFNEAYYRRVPQAGRTRVAHYGKFFYPLDALTDWNRIYGARGFHQFQNVVPLETGAAALRELLEVIAASGRASFLAVLKRLGPGRVPAEKAGHLSFPRPGYTLALDFPMGPGIEALYARLVAITLRHGGRIYLAKDALLDADAFRDMYPAWRDFRAVLEEIDPQARLQSDMSRRLRLRDAA